MTMCTLVHNSYCTGTIGPCGRQRKGARAVAASRRWGVMTAGELLSTAETTAGVRRLCCRASNRRAKSASASSGARSSRRCDCSSTFARCRYVVRRSRWGAEAQPPPALVSRAQRRSEIASLATLLVGKAGRALGRACPAELSAESIGVLERHDWPGNVRELRNVMERAAVMSSGDVILPEH